MGNFLLDDFQKIAAATCAGENGLIKVVILRPLSLLCVVVFALLLSDVARSHDI